MTCTKCGEKPKKNCGAFPKAVIEIDNPEKIVLLRKVLVPASMGDESTFPPTIGKYHNVLLEYEASGGIYLYSSDGIPTKLSSDVTELQAQLNALRVRVGQEEVARADADTALSNRITSLDNSLATVARTGSYNDLSNKPTIGDGTLTIKKNGSNVGTFTANATANTDVNIVVPTKTSDLANDGSDGASQYVESNDLATVATSGSYNDLTNKPTIGNATLTIKRNNANAGTFTANATTNKSINIAVPTKTSDLTNDGADGTSTYVEADDLPTVDTTYSSSSNNAIANSTVTNSLDRNVMTDLAVDSTPSTTTVNLSNTKTNLAYPSSSTTSSISLPVASSTQAGVMNSATFDAVTSNTNNINAILNGAVAISNLPASPTQAQLTTAWENETGLPSLINRASVYDVTNNKVWTYYTNDQTWHAASNTSQVTVNTFTNSSEGTIKGSTNAGQVFAESDGTGSVNGWDALTGNVANNTSKLATIAQGAEVNVQANWTQTNTNADDYIKNKPANLVQDANYVHTDNNFTTTLKNKLDGIESGAEVNVQADWSQTDTTADDYIKNKPTIPTVNNATLTIQKNGVNVQTFTANSSTNKTANITVPTAVSELTNDSGYATTTQLNNGLATKQDTLTAGSNIQINGNTISATDTTYTAGNAIDITNGEISADIHPADFFTAEDTISDCGSDLSLDNTIATTLKSVELKGDAYQQTYSGKNKINGAYSEISQTIRCSAEASGNGFKITSTSSSGATYVTVPIPNIASLLGQTVTVSYSSSGSGIRIGFFYLDSSGSATGNISYTQTTTLPSSLGSNAGIGVVFYTSNNGSATYTDIQLEIGSTATSYELYTGGIPSPNPDYPQDIHVVTGEQTVDLIGKNLLDISSLSQAAINVGQVVENGILSDTSPNDDSRYWGYANRNWTITLSPGVYTLSETFTKRCTNASIGALRIYTSSGTKLLNNYDIVNKDHVADTFTLTETTTIGIMIKIADGECYVQLEKGANATAYEPYHNQSYAIDLGTTELCKIGDYQDYIYKSGDDWYVHKEIGKFVNNNNLVYNAENPARFEGLTPNVGVGGWSTAELGEKSFCNMLQTTIDTATQQFDGLAGSYANGRIKVSLSKARATTIQEMNTVLDGMVIYFPFSTPTNTKITNATLVAQLNALAGAKSYNDQTNIIVTTAGNNLPATLCVETYRKSLSGVIEAIDSACTCRQNLVIHLPNGMTTYTNNDAPIPIPEVVEAFKRGQSVFLIDDALPERIYTVTAADMDDGIYSMRADQTGINKHLHDGYWHISGGGDVWSSVEFVHDAIPGEYYIDSWGVTSSTWSVLKPSDPINWDNDHRMYYPASSDATFSNGLENLDASGLWQKIVSGDYVTLKIPLQAISNASASLVDTGFTKDNPDREIAVTLSSANRFVYNDATQAPNFTVAGYLAKNVSIGSDGEKEFLAGIVRVIDNGNSTYSFVVSLTEAANPIN